VCGATNIAPGQRIPVALPGAVLPGGRRNRGAPKDGRRVQRELCSGDELRLTADAEGILVLPADSPLGVSLAEVYGDTVLDGGRQAQPGRRAVDLGLAREVAAATRQTVRRPEISVEEGSGPATASGSPWTSATRTCAPGSSADG